MMVVGKKIKKGDVLCIIEAMKLMNEVTSDIDGEIIETLVENRSIVEYGQPLFKVRKV
jgi:biotin carboxyl carrier protein